MIITIGSIKGGVGKSTLATNLAVALALQEKRVFLLDADYQGTCTNWIGDRKELDVKQIPSEHETGRLSELLEELESSYDYVLVDCQGRDSVELRSAITEADILVAPFKPSQPDIDTMYEMSSILEEAQYINPKLTTLAVVTIAPTYQNSWVKSLLSSGLNDEVSSAIDVVKTIPRITVLNTVIYDRKGYRVAIGSGVGVVELPDKKAKGEVESLLNEVLGYGNK